MEAFDKHTDWDELLVKYIAGEATGEEAQKVDEWLASDIANQNHYDHFKLIWDESLKLTDNNNVDENQAWERFKQKIDDESLATAKPANIYQLVKVAAILLAAMLTVFFLVDLFRPKTDDRFATVATKSVAPTLITLAAENVKADTLPDGSIVTQNKNSILRYPAALAGKTRNVELTGEAFFNIKHDPKRPFIININNVKITVLGTSFNVKGNGKITEVIVETGLVSVQTQQRTVTLNPGQKLTANVTQLKVSPVQDNSYRNYFDERKQILNDQVKKPAKDKVLQQTTLDHFQPDSVRKRP